MKGFAYWRDRLALAAAGLYTLNRWVLIPAGASGFWSSHFNDFLLIPAALPALLWVHRRLGIRTHDRPPGAGEIAGHLVVWSAVCEYAGPHWTARGTADPLDVVAYSAGALLAWMLWRFHPGPAPAQHP